MQDMRHRVKQQDGLASVASLHAGVVTVVQRFRSDLGLYVHLQVVHEGRSSLDRLFSAMRTPPRPIMHVSSRVPRPVAVVVDKALAFDRNARHATAKEMRDALKAAYIEVFRMNVARPVPFDAVVDTGDELNESFAEPSAVVEVSFRPPTTQPAPRSGEG